MTWTPPPGDAVDLGLTEIASGSPDLTLGASGATGPGTGPYVPPTGDAVNLTLSSLWTGTTDLTLDGEGDEAPPTDAIDVVVTGTFALRGALAVSSVSPVVTVARFALRGAVSVFYDNSVFRGPAPSFDAAWDRDGIDAKQTVRAGWQRAIELPAEKSIIYDEALSTPVSARSAWNASQPRPQDRAITWDEAAPAHTQAEGAWNYGTPAHVDTVAPWGAHALDTGRWTDIAYGHAKPTHRNHVLPWDVAAKPVDEFVTSLFDPLAARHTLATVAPWNEGKAITSYGGPWTPYQPPPPVPEGILLQLCAIGDGSTNLTLGINWCAGLIPGDTIIVPIRRYYVVINDASLRRVDGDIPLRVLNMSLTIDSDSWTWGFTASLHGSDLTNLEPASSGAPIEVEASINGVVYRAFIEQIGRERTFGRNALRVQGRGRTALLDAPYSPVLNFGNTSARTVQQLLNDVLTVNGVSMGWTVNFGLTDWLVPSNVFAHQGSYISALNTIAAAGGGYVQPHPSLQELSVLARYPVAPWEWGTVTPDFELPSAVTTREGIEFVERARYNRVFVTGQQAGVLGQVTRTGTAGDLVAPMVTDALITEAAAARQRGMAVLGNTGRIANVSLRLPVLAATGIIPPGKFVRYVDGTETRIGIVRSTSVDVGAPEIWQTIGVETHA